MPKNRRARARLRADIKRNNAAHETPRQTNLGAWMWKIVGRGATTGFSNVIPLWKNEYDRIDTDLNCALPWLELKSPMNRESQRTQLRKRLVPSNWSTWCRLCQKEMVCLKRQCHLAGDPMDSLGRINVLNDASTSGSKARSFQVTLHSSDVSDIDCGIAAPITYHVSVRQGNLRITIDKRGSWKSFFCLVLYLP